MKRILVLTLIASMAWPASAQLNLKRKFERKADQVVDDILFGKKKKNKGNDAGTSTPSTGTPNESYEPEDSNDPLGGYVRKPVNYSGMNTGEVVHFRELMNFLPDNFGGYAISEKPDGASMRFGESSYSTASKEYSNGNKEMTVGIFDYLFTGSLFGAYANAYEYESTDGMMKSIEVKGHPGWFSTTYDSGATTLTLIINNRFMLSFNLKGASEVQLRGFASSMELGRLPEGQTIEEEEPDGN